ncbi:hypothetical protein EA658_16920 [Pseudoxanthomonas winnipegensis]|jgi:hypothetical protein|uniref:Uncharacterized protein n=1 Tax=Pseudoxanthomonas winnipegensis TaxID=2480810 RepID=A0ABY1WAD4_9GAMM|nr:hypothetical protein [Pseudoxanthomonas winnipegensis]TAA07473.1 hypothetical protein EA659_16425 [Pseudoxanthomonas winnipegensis]TAA17500.1 hypothetical protein EA658_16920 [Pseudoxanthomonas winnipegensis]TAH71220.1 hypothetical protein EA657_13460 [Pseudoxanthomonas winnipegensis]
MKSIAVVSLLLLCAPLAALAQTQPLNLKLKDDTSFSGAGDPPGTYYGDHSGPVVETDPARPVSELDDGKAHVHGAFTTGIGYSKGYGSSTYNAADLSVAKAFTSDEGRTSVMRMDIHVSKSDGPFGGGPYGGYYGRGYPGPRSASGAAMRWSAANEAP